MSEEEKELLVHEIHFFAKEENIPLLRCLTPEEMHEFFCQVSRLLLDITGESK